MLLFIKSIIVGICALLPGVSGSVIAVSFGIYDRFIEYITDLDKLKKNIKYVLVVTLGVLIGIFFTSNIILYIFKYKTIIYYILLGIILSEIPFLIKKIHDETNRGIMFIPFIISFTFSILLEKLNSSQIISDYSVFKYFLGGILFSFGKVFPGISSSFFLLCLGIYEDIIILINKPYLLIINFYFYIPFILGSLFGLILFLKILTYMMNNHFRLTYSIIIGFIVSSIFILIPSFSLNIETVVGIVLSLITMVLSIYLKIINSKKY